MMFHTSGVSTPIPKAMVAQTILNGVETELKDAIICPFTSGSVQLVNISTNQYLIVQGVHQWDE